jgi:hypothetical protein
MRNSRHALTPRRLAALLAVVAVALAGYAGAPATQPRIAAAAMAEPLANAAGDPSLAGLRPGPEADPGGAVAEYH